MKVGGFAIREMVKESKSMKMAPATMGVGKKIKKTGGEFILTQTD